MEVKLEVPPQREICLFNPQSDKTGCLGSPLCVRARFLAHAPNPKSPQDLLSPGRPLNKGIRNDTGGRPSSTVRLCRIPEVSHKP